MFSPQVLDHFQNPRNAGTLADADVVAKQENPACGDVLELSLVVAEGKIVAVRFRAKGCVPAMACASKLTEMIQGRTVAEARALPREELVKSIGGLPPESMHASHLAMDALRSALAKLTKGS